MATFSERHYGGVWTDPSLARWYTLVPVLVSRLELVSAQRNFRATTGGVSEAVIWKMGGLPF